MVRCGEYVLLVQPGNVNAGQAGHHVVVYPAFALRDPDPEADYPPPLLDVVLPATPTMRPALQVLPGGRQAG